MNPSSPPLPELQSMLALLDVLDEGVLLVDRSNRVISVNRRLTCLFGFDRGALVGIDINCFMRRYLPACIAGDDLAARITASFPDRQVPVDTACTIRTLGGEERELLISGNRIEDGLLRGMGIVRFRDITDLKRAEQELLEYRTVFDSLDAGFCIIQMIFDADGRSVDYRFIETNRAFERLTGMRDVAGKTMRELAPDHEEHWFEIFDAVAKTGEPRRFTRVAIFLTERWYEVYAFPFGRPDGNRVAVLFNDITDRKQAKDKLRESEEKYRQILESMGAGYVVLEAVGGDTKQPIDFTVLDVDPAYESITGSRRDQVIGRRVSEIAPDIGRIWVERCGAGLSTGRLEQFEEYNRVWDRWYGVHVGPMPGKSRCALIFTDITERKRAEGALRESEEKFRALVEHSLDSTLILDPEGKILFVNHAAARLVGIEDPVEVIGRRNVMEFVAPESQGDVVKDFAEVAKGIDAYIARYKILTVAEEELWVESIGKSIVFMGAPAILISLRDITERQRVEEAIRQSEERFRLLTENASEIVVVLDPEGRIRYASPSVKTVGGYAPKDLIGRNVLELTHPDDLPLVRDALRTATARPKERITLEVRIRHGSGDYWQYLDIIGTNLLGEPAVRGILVNARDITDRKRAEEALRRRTDDLIRLNREVEAARDEANMYLDIMTHDVRNANNVSNMYADLLMDLVEGDLKTYAEKLHASIERSSEILRNVATIRRAAEEAENLAPVNLDAVIQNEIASFPDATIRYRDTHIKVLADGLLPTVFTNLIGNAVKFGGPDVEIDVRVEEQDGEVLVSVEDTGPGVPDEVKEKLFTRFERGMATGRGEGLGLFIVRTLVERYGGEVRVDDRVLGRPECGAAFRFTLKKA